MNRRKFFGAAAVGAIAGVVPLKILLGNKEVTVTAPICAGCKSPLVLKGIRETAVVSCSNDLCPMYWDEELLNRFYKVGEEVGLSGNT